MPTKGPLGAYTISYGPSFLRFDAQSLTIHNFPRTHRIGWAEVRRFADGCIDDNSGSWWALAVTLHKGQTVIARGTRARDVPPSKTLVEVGLVAQHYGIPADLTGTIERGSFPAALLGPSETIRLTVRDERLARGSRDPILEVTERSAPVQPGDILALGHDGSDVEVLGIRQIFTAGRWEQVAYVGDLWRYRPSPLLTLIRRIRPHFWGVC